MKTYEQLPDYLAGWDAAIMPFAHNEATRYISPTKTPEYLAAGLPVASTSIHDVVEPYERLGLVAIGDGPEASWPPARARSSTDRVRHIAERRRDPGSDVLGSHVGSDGRVCSRAPIGEVRRG